MSYKQLIGWREVTSGLSNVQIHICGYEDDKILYQTESGGKVHKRDVNENSKGVFFVAGGKRFYIFING